MQEFAKKLGGVFAFFAIIVSYPIASDTYGAPSELPARLLASTIGGLVVVSNQEMDETARPATCSYALLVAVFSPCSMFRRRLFSP